MKHEIFNKNEWAIVTQELTLSPRQSEIMHLLMSGKSDKQISQNMGIGLCTVRTHISRLFQKFNVQDRSELLLYVFKHFRFNCSLSNKK